MALLRTIKHPYNAHAVLEDPVPGSNKLYFQYDAYNKETLTPLFDVGVNHNTAGTGITGFGFSLPRPTEGQAGGLLLDGTTVWVNHALSGTSNNNQQLNLDTENFIAMDPDRPIRNVRYDTDGSLSALWLSYARFTNTFETNYAFRFNPTTDCSDSLPRVVTNSGANVTIWPVYLNPTTKNLVCISYQSSGTVYPGWSHGYRFTNYFTATPAASQHATVGQNRSNQFLGVSSADQRALFFQTQIDTDYGHHIVKYNDSDNTSTVQFTNISAPSAGGTSAGGNRGTNFGQQIAKFASSTFPDPISPGNTAFYVPYSDVNGRLHPMFFQWNRADDTFTRNTDITVDWGTASNQDNVWLPDTVSGTSVNVLYGLQRLWHNETFTITDGGITTRYLTFMQLHGGSIYDGEPKRRTFVTFQVNPTDPKILTYHSSITIPVTPKNIIWLNDEKTLLGVITHTNFYTYSFNPTLGWVQTATLSNQFWEVGKDSFGRIWALELNQTGYYNIHILTLNVPINIVVTAPQSTYNFTGSPISETLKVNAYSPQGQRIEANIKLVIDGGSMAFAGANLTTTVTTSTTADTNVPVTISGGGISNIIASVVL